MKLKLTLGITLILFFFTQCNRSCTELQNCTIPEPAEKYLNNYKAGTYWIYFSKDKTKKDSVFISDFSVSLLNDRFNNCNQWETKHWKMKATYLNNGEIMKGYSSFGKCDVFDFYCVGTKINDVNIKLQFKNNSFFSRYEMDTVDFINSFLIESTQQTYTDVLEYNHKYWFAPKFGLIQYIANTDTFYLHKLFTL